MTTTVATPAALADLAGRELGLSDWHQITQQHIDPFAEATGDHHWIHIDPERAAEGPFGSTIAHG
jgi:acyl dehydratase